VGNSGDIVGPLRAVRVGDWQAPVYMLPFDEDGVCTAPRTRAHLIDAVRDAQVTNVVLLSHGWNTNWVGATGLYDTFIDGLLRVRAQQPDPAPFRPIFVGIFWPSIVLTLPWERGPRIAGGADAPVDGPAEDWQEQLRTVAQTVEPGARGRFYELATQPGLNAEELTELATLLAPVWAGADAEDELGGSSGQDAAGLVALWQKVAAQFPAPPAPAGPTPGPGPLPPPGPFSGAGGAGPLTGGPAAAGALDLLDPRNLVRVTTVRMMKDRAGRVGGAGVAALLGDVLGAGGAAVHLVGHSYGGKVVLSAVGRMPDAARPVESVLLLQPALSYLCFDRSVPGLGRPGGYRPALARSRQPVLTTFSSRDVPLGTLFHLAVNRDSDLGEQVIAAAPPSRYAALGGYGPTVDEPASVTVAVSPPGSPYDRGGDREVLGIQASDVISGHGDINNPSTWWMLADQVRRAREGQP
jgi:hypothetical protein